MLNAPVQASVNQTECLINQKSKRSKPQGNYSQLLYQKNKHERTKRKDQAWRRLATVNKIAQKAGYNLPNYSEKKTIAELLQLHGEYSYLTGKRLGTYYLSTLDIDIRKENFAEKLTERLEKNTACLLDYLQTSYDQTKKGLHVDILTPEPLPNEIIYWVDKLGKKWNIGSIQSLGKYVVGEDPHKSFINNGKWYWKTKNNEEVKITLNQFFFYLSNQEKTVEKQNEINSSNTFPYEAWNSLTKEWEKKVGFWSEKEQKIVPVQQDLKISSDIKEPLRPPTTKHTTIHAKLLRKQKTNLEKIWKIFYLDQQGHRGYFLLNDYHRNNFNLNIGTTRSILLVNGWRHRFFSRVL